MHRLLQILFLLLSFALTSSGTTETKPPSTGSSGVIPLTAKNFDSSLRDGSVWLVEFYAPWCSHCVRFAPTYELVAQQLHRRDGDARKVKVAKVDGAAERALSSRFGVKGFPTFFLVDGWTVYEYDGARSQDQMVQFALVEYKEAEPLPFLFGPFGPMGQARSLLMRSGSSVVGVYDNLIKERGMRPLVAMTVLCAAGMGGGLLLIVVVGILCMPKPKND